MTHADETRAEERSDEHVAAKSAAASGLILLLVVAFGMVFGWVGDANLLWLVMLLPLYLILLILTSVTIYCSSREVPLETGVTVQARPFWQPALAWTLAALGWVFWTGGDALTGSCILVMIFALAGGAICGLANEMWPSDREQENG